jgi:hypothetical protein
MIKSFEEYNVNESVINESQQLKPTEEQFEAVRAHLPELEELINKTLGTKKGDFKLEVYDNRKTMGLRTTNDLCFLLGNTLVKTLFKELMLDFWGGQYIQSDNAIWFAPKIWWRNPEGGQNGKDFIWSSLWFKLDTNEWVPSGAIFA